MKSDAAPKSCIIAKVIIFAGLLLELFCSVRPTSLQADELGRLTFQTIDDSDPDPSLDRVCYVTPKHPAQVEPLRQIRFMLRYENDQPKGPPKEKSNQITYRLSRHEHRAIRASQLDRLLAHQNAIKKLEAIGYAVKYENNNRVPADFQAPFVTRNSAYVRNVLAERIVVPVVAICPYRWAWCGNWDGDSTKIEIKKLELDKLTAEMLLPFTQVRLLDLSESKFSLKDFETLQALPKLETLHLSKKMLEPEMRDKIQLLLPRCNLKDHDGLDPDWKLEENLDP